MTIKKFHILLTYCVGALFFNGCATTKKSAPVNLTIPSSEVREILTQKIILSLKDPESARFNSQIVIVDNKSACVEVNAKNTFGGYSGFQQAVLVNIKDVGWQVIKIADISRELCINTLHQLLIQERLN